MAPARSPRSLVHQLETSAVPLKTLEAVRELRRYLDLVEATALCDARDVGASITDIAEALGTTRQTVYNRLKQLAEEKRARDAAETVVVPDVEPEPQG
jgi:transposase-like protein